MGKYLKTKEGSIESAVLEAMNPAQQAAIAISKKKKAGKPGYDDKGKSLKNDVETDEELSAKQKKIDLNKNGKIDADDLANLRKKADKKEEVELKEKPADYLELEFNSSRDAAKAYDYINNKLYSGGHQPFTMMPNEGSSLQFEDMDDADKVMAQLKKARFKFKVYERESVQEETLAQQAAKAISDMWAEASKSPKEEEEEMPKKKESKKTTMTGKPMADIEINPKSKTEDK